MERHAVMTRLRALKLRGMAAVFEEVVEPVVLGMECGFWRTDVFMLPPFLNV